MSCDCSLKNLPVPNIEESTDPASINPAEESSSIVGKSDSFFILKWFKKFSVVAYCIGFPGTFLRPAGLTQSNSNKISRVFVAKATPLIDSISDLVTGWW